MNTQKSSEPSTAATTPELLRELADAVDKDRRHANSFLTRTMRQAAEEIDWLREQVNSGRTGRERGEGLPEGTLPRV